MNAIHCMKTVIFVSYNWYFRIEVNYTGDSVSGTKWVLDPFIAIAIPCTLVCLKVQESPLLCTTQ